MAKVTALMMWTVLFISCSGCSAQNQINKNVNQQNNSTMKIKSMATGFVKSGNYGGSTQHEQFSSVYNYSFFNGETSAKNEEFQALLDLYLQNIKVNNSVTLQEYLAFLYENNTEKLQEIHGQNQEKKEVGNSRQELPTLFFVDDDAGNVLRIDPYLVQLSWNQHSTNLNQFLQENAKHFSSEIPDEFYTKYYGK